MRPPHTVALEQDQDADRHVIGNTVFEIVVSRQTRGDASLRKTSRLQMALNDFAFIRAVAHQLNIAGQQRLADMPQPFETCSLDQP
ncbi:hypothetical protein D3C80_2092020 [compost metagenome]